ncbi:hypothetical protein ABZ357_31670 [Streptomyces sp. NPDC005917]|uniref:hypothetical protein n=1 Tax=unclassified Streptomyces TaxID=2593676 RepID=UPI0033D6FA37
MFAFELHEIRAAELRRRAEDARLAREAVRARRVARREEAARHAAVPEEVHTGRRSRRRLPGTA